MECIYIDFLEEDTTTFEVPDEEARHLKALRINTGDIVQATNGRGLVSEMLIERLGKTEFLASPIRFVENFGEPDTFISIGMGILEDKDRMEFALEKSIELGAKEFFPLITDFTQKTKFNNERMNAKAIASIKQCKRACLPTIHEPLSFSQMMLKLNSFDTIILADENGVSPDKEHISGKVLLLIGPEGGFSERELSNLSSPEIIKWALGNRRLRAETALIAALSFAGVM